MLQVQAQAYSVEAANPRHGYEWHVWEDAKLPDGKLLIPGVITHTTAVVEHPETVAERIMNFAKVVGRERVIAGAEGAELATRHLWARALKSVGQHDRAGGPVCLPEERKPATHAILILTPSALLY
jgi:methionine synthase II (cobalamin-independent)